MSDSRNRRRLNTSPSVDARVRELFKVLDAVEQQRRVSTFLDAVQQKSLVKFESSVSSILSTLKASIQALA